MSDPKLYLLLGKMIGKLGEVSPVLKTLQADYNALSGRVGSLETELKIYREADKDRQQELKDTTKKELEAVESRLSSGNTDFKNIGLTLQDHTKRIGDIEAARSKAGELGWKFVIMIAGAIVSTLSAIISGVALFLIKKGP